MCLPWYIYRIILVESWRWEEFALLPAYEIAVVARLLRPFSDHLRASWLPCSRWQLSHFLSPILPVAPSPRLRPYLWRHLHVWAFSTISKNLDSLVEDGQYISICALSKPSTYNDPYNSSRTWTFQLIFEIHEVHLWHACCACGLWELDYPYIGPCTRRKPTHYYSALYLLLFVFFTTAHDASGPGAWWGPFAACRLDRTPRTRINLPQLRVLVCCYALPRRKQMVGPTFDIFPFLLWRHLHVCDLS